MGSSAPVRFARFTGSPLYVLYLRALGAKIGKGVSDPVPQAVPVCPRSV